MRNLAVTIAVASWCVNGVSQQAAATPKLLHGREVLASSERFCVSVPIHPNRAINLGAAQLTVTFAAEKKPGDDVVLVSRLTGAQTTVPQGDATVMLCGAVPDLSEKQTGQYEASDFAIHFGSGNVTNIGTPDESLVDTKALAEQLTTLHPKFVR